MRITDKFVFFFTGSDVCSNFYPCKIIYEEKEFSSSEQLFMWLKAKFFNDKEMSTKILQAQTPREAKSLGRLVKNYDDDLWNEHRDGVMLESLKAKFDHCQEFKDLILGNTDKTFVEASPYDRIWGVGLSETDPKIENPNKWLGQNRLGKCINKLIETL